jgi:hypothetical protein
MVVDHSMRDYCVFYVRPLLRSARVLSQIAFHEKADRSQSTPCEVTPAQFTTISTTVP